MFIWWKTGVSSGRIQIRPVHFKLGLSLHITEVGKEKILHVQEPTSEVKVLHITDDTILAKSFKRNDNIAKVIRNFKYEENDSFSGEDHIRFAMSFIDHAQVT